MDELVLRVYAVNRERSIVKVDQHISSFLHTFSRRCFIPTRQKTTLTTNSKQGSSVLESKACSTSRAFHFFVSSTQSNTLSFSAHGSRLTAHGSRLFTFHSRLVALHIGAHARPNRIHLGTEWD